MKEGKLVLMVLIAAMGIEVYPEDSKEVWIFPPSTYIQSLTDYDRNFNFDFGNIIDFASFKNSFGYFPFFVCNKDYFYLSYGGTPLRIDRSTIRISNDYFQTYSINDSQEIMIIGGGYFFTSLDMILYDDFFTKLLKMRTALLKNRIEYIESETPEMIDWFSILPQIIKKVSISAPFLTEIVRGEKVTYDDDMLFYRWFYYGGGSRALKTAFFINDPTPLVEGAPGSGAGLSLEVEFHIPSDNLVVLNGFVDLDRKHLYRLNARMKRVRVTGAGFEFEYEFADYVHFAQIDFPSAVTAVKLTVLEVYEGEKYEDLAISGLFVNPDVLKTRNSTLAYEYRDEAEKAYQKQNQQKR
ncbi:MAG TPA: hypothetical protein PLG79_12490 [Spirochaetales bacterium]|nr:hypothetical protein [Spirochaetales bacterium]